MARRKRKKVSTKVHLKSKVSRFGHAVCGGVRGSVSEDIDAVNCDGCKASPPMQAAIMRRNRGEA